MIGIAMVGTDDMARARRFYDAVLPLLGAGMHAAWSTDRRSFYVAGPGLPMFAVARPFDGGPAAPGNGAMVAFAAAARATVDAVHAAAVEAGGADEGGPGHRGPEADDLYRAYFRDLDGNKLMVFALEPR